MQRVREVLWNLDPLKSADLFNEMGAERVSDPSCVGEAPAY
jgi:hypothetical protein